MKQVIMPALGMAQETGIIIQWLKQEGDPVQRGDVLLEVETDKATAELEAEATGTLRGISAFAGDEVPVATTIAFILKEGESLPRQAVAEKPAASSKAAAPTVSAPTTATPLANRIAREHAVDLNAVTPADGKKISKSDVLAFLDDQPSAARLLPASPLARRMAAENGLALSDVTGSGPDGAVLVADVQARLAAQPEPTPAPAISGTAIPMSRAWSAAARRLTESFQTVPHFYLQREVDVSEMKRWRTVAQAGSAEKVTYTDLLIKCVAAALAQHPRVNASCIDNKIIGNSAVNVCIAVATDDGLVVPTIPNTDKLTVAAIAPARKSLVERALAGKLKLDELQGGTFTISNLGMYGIDQFSAIINPPQAAILAVGRIADKIVAVDGQPQVRPMMTLVLSLDHRVVDGARGAQFMETLISYLQQPMTLL